MIDPKVTSRGATLYNVEQIAKKMISPRCAGNGTIETELLASVRLLFHLYSAKTLRGLEIAGKG